MVIKGVSGDGILGHAGGCSGRTFTKCQAVVLPPVPEIGDLESDIEVVRMDWCSDCGAADWELV